MITVHQTTTEAVPIPSTMEFICWYENVAFKQDSAALGSKFPGFVANLQADTSTHWAEPYSRPPQANCQLTTTLPWLQWLSCPSEDPDNRAAYARQTHSLGLWDEKWIYWRVQEKPWFRARNGGRGGAVCIYLRGAPSAISIAVIPKDQISLCGKKHTHKTRSVSNHHMLTVTQTLHKVNSCNRFQYIIVLVVSRLRTGGRR